MNIPEHHVEALKAFGYTDAEARFLYIVATHSGHFTSRQFLTFVDAKRGNRSFTFAQKLATQGHASMREYLRNGCIYHLYSRRLYAQLDRENLRNRRRHHLEFKPGFLSSILFSRTKSTTTSRPSPKKSATSAIS